MSTGVEEIEKIETGENEKLELLLHWLEIKSYCVLKAITA
jgi:hypothetical protein